MEDPTLQFRPLIPPAVQPLAPGFRPPPLRPLAVLAGGALLGLAGLVADAAIIAVQDFEPSPATPTATYSAIGGGFITGNSGDSGGPYGSGGDRPSGVPYYSGGARAYQLNGGTGTLTFDALDMSSYTGIQLTVRVAAFAAASSVQGLDDPDYVEMQISPDNGLTYYPTVRVKGNSNAYWCFTSGTGNASAAYDGDATAAVFAPTGGGSRTTDGYSTITITSLPAVSLLRVKIVMKNDSLYERWVLDDLQLTGTPAATLAAGNNGPVCAGATLSLTASTISGASYAWTGPNGFASSLQNPTISNATPAATGTYSVTATVNDWTSPPATTTATVNPAPATSAISGSDAVAIGQVGKVYTVTPTGGSSYAWTVPTGAAIIAGVGTASIAVTFGSASGDIGVTETTAAGCVGAPVSLAVTVGPNHAPVAHNNTLSTAKNTPASIANAKLLSGATDADHDALTVIAAETTTPGATVNWSGTEVTYTPPTNLTGSDSFTFTVSDGNGGTAVGTVAVTVTANSGGSLNIVSPPSYDGTTFHVTFAGIPGYQYTVEYGESSTGPWTFLKTATAGADGLFEVQDDPPPEAPARYYRTTYP